VPDFESGESSGGDGQTGAGEESGDSGAPAGPGGMAVERTLVVEVYDDFPNIALVSIAYKNVGTTDFQINQVVMQQHRFNAKRQDAKAQPYDMWSFQGSSYDWGEDDVQKLTRTSAQPNLMGEAVKGGYGGGIPVVAFWTGSVGEAIGDVETLPWTLSIPVKVEGMGG
jgi:alpha-galactosidase